MRLEHVAAAAMGASPGHLSARLEGVVADLLNPNNLQPVAFEPRSLVRDQHELGLRLSNKLTLPGEPEATKYWAGLAIAPALMIGLYFAWGVAICVSRCCRTRRGCAYRWKKEPRRTAFYVFLFSSLASIALWIAVLAIGADFLRADEALRHGVGNIADRFQRVDDSLLSLLAMVLEFNSAEELFRAANCSNEFVDVIIGAVRPPLQSLEGLLVELTGDTIPAMNSSLQAVLEQPHTSIMAVLFETNGALMLLLSVGYLAMTCVSQFKAQEHVPQWLHWFSRAWCGALTLVVVVLSACILTAIIAYVVASVGADFCVPNPETTLMRLMSNAKRAPQLAVTHESGVPICSPIPGLKYSNSRPSSTMRTTCYYMTCEGDTSIHEVLERIFVFVNDTLPHDLPIEEESASCKEAFNVLVVNLLKLAANVGLVALQDLQCHAINKLYSSIVHHAVCDTMVHTFANGWRIALFGAFVQLMGVFVARHFCLDKPPGDMEALPDEFCCCCCSHSQCCSRRDNLGASPKQSEPGVPPQHDSNPSDDHQMALS